MGGAHSRGHRCALEVAKCFNLRGCFYKFVIKAVENTLHCENVEMTCLFQLSSTKFWDTEEKNGVNLTN